MPQFRYWVFDLDGTLVDSFSHYENALRAIFTEEGVPFVDDHLRQGLAMSARDLLAAHLKPDRIDVHYSALNERSFQDADLIRPYDGVHECLESLKSEGARIAVWTGRDKRSAQRILDASGLARYVELLVSGTCVTMNKPNSEGLLRVLQHFAKPPSPQVVMVGDHDHDMMAAREVGTHAVRVTWCGLWNVDRCERAHAQFERFDDFRTWAAAEALTKVEDS